MYLFPAITAFSLTVICCLSALKFFPQLGLVDQPQKYGLKRKPIPYFGGLIIFSVFIFCSLIFFPINNALIGFIIASSLLTATNFYDDKYGVSPYLRLGIQIICAFILIIFGIGISQITNPFGGEIALLYFEFLFTILWVLGMTNTMNWLDGINGLPSGITFIGALTLFFLSISSRVNQPTIATLSIILAMICLAFLIFDFYPAKILMGDTGSMFLGFTLATIAIFSGGKVATAFLVMGFPILDMAWVILRRLKNKKSPFHGDRKHFHHRLLEAGFTDRQALIFIYFLCGSFGITALFLNTFGKFIAIILLSIVMIGTSWYLVRKITALQK